MDEFAKKLIANGQTSISNYLLANYTQIGMTSNELVMFIQIKRYADAGIQFPKIDQITQSTGFQTNEAYEILHQMIKKHLMRIDTTHNQNGQRCDQYNFQLLYQKLERISKGSNDNNDNWRLNEVDRTEQSPMTESSRLQVFQMIQKEFGRQLSPMEISTVSGWLDQDNYRPKMVALALREAVLNQVFNFRYIEKILMSWKSQGLNTPQKLQTAKQKQEKQGQGFQKNYNSNQKQPHIPIFKL